VRTTILVYLLLTFFLVGSSHASDQPKLAGAKVIARSAEAGLQTSIRDLLKSDAMQGSSSWIAYSVPLVAGEHHVCCFNNTSRHDGSCCGTCRLEPRSSGLSTADHQGDCQPALISSLYVFLRAENRQIEQVRVFSSDCLIDATGATVYWLNQVVPAQSVSYLESLLPQDAASPTRHRTDEIVTAIALHQDPTADHTLEKLVQPGQPAKVRQQAAFWIGNSRGNHGLDILIPLIKSDDDRRFLEQATFAVSQSSEHDRAFKILVDFARRDPRSQVREQALFWLAQEAGKKAAGVIADSIENDPETDVKKKAVFALSELPQEEGVPLLIEQARNNRNPVVRKEAVFWLGQSQDPRALDFITSILEH